MSRELEIWRPSAIRGQFYEVSNFGRVRSKTTHDGRATRPGKILSLGGNGWGHKKAQLCKGGKHTSYYVHRLVLETFVGPCPEGMEACHINGNPADNRLDNLRWDTKLSNELDKRKHGTLPLGEKHCCCRLSDKEIGEIHEMRNKGWTQARIAAAMNTSQSHVSMILSGKSRRAALAAVEGR